MKIQYTKTDSSSTRPFVILSAVGIVIGLLLAIPAIWADWESASYGFARRSNTTFQGLRCPVFMGRDEHQVVSVRVHNQTDKPISPAVKIVVSTAEVFESKVEFIKLAPGEQITLQRSVGPENIDLGQFIFVNAQIYTAYPMPDQENTCGIFVLPITDHGSLILVVGTFLSILFMASGILLLHRRWISVSQSRSWTFLAIVTLLTMFFGLMGWWLIGLISLVVFVVALWSLLAAFALRT
jgi:hypothetical protein